tara:strand:+ start:80 stop:292 length:213 start_codon:yes stop_codon:yes gene_type:complete
MKNEIDDIFLIKVKDFRNFIKKYSVAVSGSIDCFHNWNDDVRKGELDTPIPNGIYVAVQLQDFITINNED